VSTTHRHLEVLALLQARPGISATRLAARFGVTERTARRDVARLRELGYRIDAEAGRDGGYRLASGATMPPLLLDADEVAAVALGLRTAVTAVAVDGLETAAVTARAKLTQDVPSRWRTRLTALADVQAPPAQSRRRTGRDVLITAALTCRAGEAVRIRHRRDDTADARPVDVQPHRLVTLRRRWYLIACPRGATGWLVYALDRVEHAQPLGTRFPAPEPPADAAAFVADTLAHGPWRHRVHVRVHTSADLVRELVDPSVATVVDDGGGDGTECELHLGTDDLDWAARWLAYLNLDLDVIEPAALADRLRALGRWLLDRY
jgi:predicted DNA-binding transcriptional regulator YafY